MSGPNPPLPSDVSRAADAWLDGGGDSALDALADAVAAAPELDGDVGTRLAAIQADLALSREEPWSEATLSETTLDTLAAGLRLPATDPAADDSRERAVLAHLNESRANQNAATTARRSGRKWPVWLAGAALAASALLVLGLPSPTPLVSADEASATVSTLPTRGEADAFHPMLRLVQPAGPVSGSFDLAVVAAPAVGGAPLDWGSLRVVYARGDRPDLTTRLDGQWVGDRFLAEGLVLPPGEHPLVIEILDEEQNLGRLEATILAR
jgi:hypothetical protein